MQLKDFDLIVRSSASDPHASSVERAGVVFPFGTGDPQAYPRTLLPSDT